MYIYHEVPKNIDGTHLISLSEIKKVNNDLYIEYTKKYLPNRLVLLERKIPKLGCFWNDVIHCLPIHPTLVYRGLIEAGANRVMDRQFFRIDLREIERECLVALFKYSKKNWRGIFEDVLEEEIEMIESTNYKELTELPKEAIDYYIEQIPARKPFGLYHFVPHIFIQGKIDVSNLSVINWSDSL
jgi:hypothetical protein